MDAKKTREFRLQLLSEQEKLIKSMGRSRSAEDEIGGVKTEDEADLATISQEKGILYSLQESDFIRLRFIQEALHALDRGEYGDCRRCGGEIGLKRLMAVPWATTCVVCQEATEGELTFSRVAETGMRATDSDS